MDANPTAGAKAATKAWATKFYARPQFTNDMLRTIAARTPNDRAFVQLTTQPIASGSYNDEFDGRIMGRYVYRIQGVSPNGLAGPLGSPAPPVSLHDVLPPDRPAITKVTIGNRSAILQWSANRESDLDHYEVYRAVANGEEVSIREMERRGGDLPTSQTSYADTGLAPGRRYTYCVVAVDTSGNRSLPSRAREAVGIATLPLSAPAASANRTSEGTALIGWSVPEEGTRGLVERIPEGGTAWTPISGWLPSNQAYYEDKGSTPNVRYKVRIRDAAGNISQSSIELILP